MLVEVIACSLADAVVAREAGADRVELCLAIEVGGLTPYLSTIRSMASLDPYPISVMVRPRSGDFVGCLDEILVQIEEIVSLGLPHLQIVSGALTSENELDLPAMRKIRAAAGDLPLVCHRCFDLTPYPLVAVEQLIDLGFNRILTSGQAPSAALGLEAIAGILDQASERIEVIVGSGIRPHNVREIIQATGVRQVHASCFADGTKSKGKIDFGPTLKVDGEKVREFVKAAKG